MIFWQVLTAIGLNLAYVCDFAKFNYMGFTYTFNLIKLLLGSLTLIIVLFLNFFIKDKFIYAVWNILFIYLFAAEMVYYQYSKETTITQLISIGVVLILLIFVSRSKGFFSNIKNIRNINLVLSILSFILFIPFLVLYYKYIDIKNIFLINVYQTRALFREISIPLTGYIMAPLVRVILPFLVVDNMEKRKWGRVLLFSLMIIYVYLCGALKSVFFGLISLFLFYKGDYPLKVIRFLKAISFFTYFGVAIALIFDNVFLLDIFIRRIFFVPAYLNTIYINHFSNNFTYLSHSPFGFGLVSNNFNGSLSMYVGEIVMGLKGLNANVGVFTEGYISFGYFGLLLFGLLISLIFLFLKMIRIDSKYFGIVFIYIYYLNTAFLSTLLLTHGLMFFLIFSFLFLRKKKDNV